MRNIQPMAGDNIKDFTAINMWYERLDERYNFSLDSAILPLLTTENLEQLETLESPFLKDIKTRIHDTLLFGKKNILIYFYFELPQEETHPKRATHLT